MTRSTKPTEIPSAWFNLMPHLSDPPKPAINPDTRQPLTADDFAGLFAEPLAEQELSTQDWIDIPGGVLDVLRIWRPTPLRRAHRLEQALDTPARIYFKDESTSPPGSHKANTAVPQAYYNARDGKKRLVSETGAGQWGSSISFASSQYNQECTVYMVRSSLEQKPYRRVLMEIWGSTVLASPVNDPADPGSLSGAVSEAVNHALANDDTGYTIGSVLNHVLLHQTVIGLEAKDQLRAAGEDLPHVVIGACGGGSNLGGIAIPFVLDPDVRLLAVEPASCPTLTKGTFEYDYGDLAGLTPLIHMYTLGHEFKPPALHAAGLRYHGDAPLISVLVRDGRMETRAYSQDQVFAAAVRFARAEGRVAAPETSHALRAVIDEALAAKEAGEERVILFSYSGHGLLDLSAYDEYLSGGLPAEPAMAGTAAG
jgi:tryptophan synthase beta chain